MIDEELREKPFILGDSYSVADICLYGYLHTAHEGGFELARFPAVTAWLNRVAARPGHMPQ